MQMTKVSLEADKNKGYTEPWKTVFTECKKTLEPGDYVRTLKVIDVKDFCTELEQIENQYLNQVPYKIAQLFHPNLQHYQHFVELFVNMMTNKVDASMFWGLFCLVIKACFYDPSRKDNYWIRSLSIEFASMMVLISKMLEHIVSKLRKLNQRVRSVPDQSQIKGYAVEINQEMAAFWLKIITTFRDHKMKKDEPVQVSGLTMVHDVAIKTITDAISRIEKVTQPAGLQRKKMDPETFKQTLAIEDGAYQPAQLPYYLFPAPENKYFYGRENFLTDIDTRLKPEEVGRGLRSLMIYGLGGVGKTQIALEYAHRKRKDFNAILWIPANSKEAMQQAFSKIACDILKLPNAGLNSDSKNMILVMTWLQKTRIRWLLIYDNVESPDVLRDGWPTTTGGAMLITTRNPSIAPQLIARGLEVQGFAGIDGARLFMRLLAPKNQHKGEESAAIEVSRELGGHALAISQVAAYINARPGLTIEKFLDRYRNSCKKFHRKKNPEREDMGYKHGLDTVLNTAFESLTSESFARLCVLSFLSPDAIAVRLFEDIELPDMLDGLDFLEEDMSHQDMIWQLTSTALVRLDVTLNTLSLHRLVQTETHFRMDINKRQRAFDGAVKVVLKQFPHRGSMVTMNCLFEAGAKYLQHIRVLAQHWADSQHKSGALKPTSDFCNLLANAAWLVQHNDTTDIMSIVVDTSFVAFEKLTDSKVRANQLLYCDILLLGACFHLKNGDFQMSERLARQAYQIRTDLQMPQDLQFINIYSSIGLACDSALKHHEARFWFAKIDAYLKGRNEEVYVRLSCQNQLNSARNYRSTKQYPKAKECLQQALAKAAKYNDWYSFSHIYEIYASCLALKGKLMLAHRKVNYSRQLLSKAGDFASMSWTSTQCAYRAAVVAIEQKHARDAVEKAHKCTAITRLCNAPIGWQARAMHILAKAYALDANKAIEAEDARREAQRLRKQLPPNRTDLSDESDHAFEMLVDISNR